MAAGYAIAVPFAHPVSQPYPESVGFPDDHIHPHCYGLTHDHWLTRG